MMEVETLYEEVVSTILSRWIKEREINPELIESELPFVDLQGKKNSVLLTLISPFRKDLNKFFYEMVVKWLLPGRELSVKRFFSERRMLFPLEVQSYLLMEIECMNLGEYEQGEIMRNFPLFAREVKLGVRSIYHSRKLLEIKYLTNDEKVSAIQERVSYVLSKFPSYVDYDVFDVMQRFILASTEEYKHERDSELLAKIILTSYVFTQKLSFLVNKNQEKRHLLVKLISSHLTTPFGEQNVLGIFVGLNFLKDHEFFEKKHLVKAIEKFCPDIEVLEESYFSEERKEEKTLTCYLEISREKTFVKREIEELKGDLQNHLKNCIESLVRPVFMPKNEEETMKYVVTLSKQIRDARDLPQIVIAFDEQDDSELFFTVICARPFHEKMYPMERLPDLGGEMFKVRIEKIKHVKGVVPLEVAIVKICIDNLHFLRDDFVVDLFQAREALIGFLEGAFGELRDYNGGMISKQKEVFGSFKEALIGMGEKEESLIEQFFNFLFPMTMRSIVHLDLLTKFYLGFKKSLLLEEKPSFFQEIDRRAVYIYFKLDSEFEKEEVLSKVDQMRIPSLQLLHFDLSIKGSIYLGWLYIPETEKEKELFIKNFTR